MRSLQQLISPFINILIILTVAALFAPKFLGISTFHSILESTAFLLPAVLGMQALLIAGKFDLSTGAIAAFAGVVFSVSIKYFESFGIASIIGLFSAILVSLTTGMLIGVFKLDGLVVTLAVMGIARSLALAFANGSTISSLPAFASNYFHGENSGNAIYVALIILLGFAFMLTFHIPTRRLYAIGSSSESAIGIGLPYSLIVIYAFVLAGLGASITGILQASRALSASPLIFQDLAIDSIASCILGGGTLRGGKGSAIGATLGLLIVVATRNLVVSLDVSVYMRYLVIGLLLISAMVMETFLLNEDSQKSNLNED